MPTAPLDAKTAKHLQVFVTFKWGASLAHVARYVRFDFDVSNFTAAPELSIESEPHRGDVQDATHRITLRRSRAPLDTLLRPYAHAPVQVEIGEADAYDFTDSYRVVFVGRVAKSTRNSKGLGPLATLEIAGWKELLSAPLGVVCSSSCAHVLGDKGCGVDLSAYTHSVTCDSLDGLHMTCTGLPSKPAGYFRFGDASYDGLRIGILDDAGGTFRMAQPPPPEWIGQTITMIAGCDKRIDGDCRNLFDNEERFLGLGVRMPSKNPIYEDQT